MENHFYPPLPSPAQLSIHPSIMQSPYAMDNDDLIPLINSQVDRTERVKIINDPIHGHFEVSGIVLDAIDTPHLQRLRDLKQLGGTYLVYPGASHNRFEHSLGVAHLSRTFVHELYNNPRDPTARMWYDNERQFIDSMRLVELAGLCHDLGHGPYSHLFDHDFLPAVIKHDAARENPLMQHEARSVMLFEHLVDEFQIDIDSSDVRHIGDLIARPKKPHRNAEPLVPVFLYDVVANGTTGIDTDKFDYLARDVYNVGLQGASGFDHRRLIKFAKVVDENICFHRKEIFNVYHLFLTRFQLHRTVYNHPAALSIDAMVTDAFLEANSALKIADSISDPEEFLTMTDCLIPIIERSKEASLARARKIIRRLRRRQLYRFVDEILLPAGTSFKVTPEQITTCQDAAGMNVNLVPDDVHVAHVTLNFGKKAKNPVEEVFFFSDWGDRCATQIPSTKASYVIPAHFEEKIIRVFSKREDSDDSTRVKNAIKIAFRKFLRSKGLCSPISSPVMLKRGRQCDNSGASSSDADEGLGQLLSTDPSPRRRGGGNGGMTMDERVAKRTKPVTNFVDYSMEK